MNNPFGGYQYGQFGNYGQMTNPVTPSFQMPPQAQVQQPNTTLSGRIVNSADEITPNEVPMNGSVALFPSADGSTIYVKGWNKDGTISTVQYMPVETAEKQEEEGVSLLDIMDSLDDIRDLIKAEKKPVRRTTKKGAADDAEQNAD